MLTTVISNLKPGIRTVDGVGLAQFRCSVNSSVANYSAIFNPISRLKVPAYKKSHFSGLTAKPSDFVKSQFLF
jgi:hypothetical protein